MDNVEVSASATWRACVRGHVTMIVDKQRDIVVDLLIGGRVQGACIGPRTQAVLIRLETGGDQAFRRTSTSHSVSQPVI